MLPRKVVAAVASAIVIGAVGACARPTPSDALPIGVDSLVLERTLCFGTCPAYRLSLARDGEVRFESRNPGDTERRERDKISATSLAALMAVADSLGFETLPDTIARNRTLCADEATDHPTATVTIFRGGQSKHVVDYHGCFARSDHSTVPVIGRLRQFEASIDSITGSRRWVRPARRR